jgi:hypothetical protein
MGDNVAHATGHRAFAEDSQGNVTLDWALWRTATDVHHWVEPEGAILAQLCGEGHTTVIAALVFAKECGAQRWYDSTRGKRRWHTFRSEGEGEENVVECDQSHSIAEGEGVE